MKWNVGTKIAAGFGITVVIFLIVGLLTYRSLVELVDASEWRKHSYDVLNSISALQLQLKDLESGPRSFALPGEEVSLQPYQPSSAQIENTLAPLRQLTADNARQQQRLTRIEPLFRSRMDIARETIDARRKGGLEGAEQVVKS